MALNLPKRATGHPAAKYLGVPPLALEKSRT